MKKVYYGKNISMIRNKEQRIISLRTESDRAILDDEGSFTKEESQGFINICEFGSKMLSNNNAHYSKTLPINNQN